MNQGVKIAVALGAIAILCFGAITAMGAFDFVPPHLQPLLGFFCILLGVAGLAGAAGALIGPSRPGKTKHSPYECGSPLLQATRSKFDVRFFMLALVFILFDIETILLLPYVIQYDQFNTAELPQGNLIALGIAGIFFLGLVESLIYAWKKGALDWD